MNTQIVFLFILLLALSIGSTIGASIRSVSADLVIELHVEVDRHYLVVFRFKAMVSYGNDLPGGTRFVSSFHNKVFFLTSPSSSPSSAKEFIEGAWGNVTPICNFYSL